MLQLTVIANLVSKLRLLHYIVTDISQTSKFSKLLKNIRFQPKALSLQQFFLILLTNWWAVPSL